VHSLIDFRPLPVLVFLSLFFCCIWMSFFQEPCFRTCFIHYWSFCLIDVAGQSGVANNKMFLAYLVIFYICSRERLHHGGHVFYYLSLLYPKLYLFIPWLNRWCIALNLQLQETPDSLVLWYNANRLKNVDLPVTLHGTFSIFMPIQFKTILKTWKLCMTIHQNTCYRKYFLHCLLYRTCAMFKKLLITKACFFFCVFFRLH